MTDRIAHKYRAFISYSHADTRWAKWLHQALEGFFIDKDLAGRETGLGPVPKSLRPIFRDREDFTAGHTLGEQTLAALDQSHALIVLCSPKSAQSRYVNEEIRLFRQRHPERPVIPVIADGKPGGGDEECFAPALRFKLQADGSVGSEPEPDLLAADTREEGDGQHLALAKVVARLLGLSTDDVFRRAERGRRRQARLRMAVASVVGLLFLAGAYLLWQSQERGHTIAQQQQLIAEAAGIAKQLLAANPAAAASPNQEENLVSALSAIQRNAAAGDGDYARALQLLKDGKGADAVPLLLGAAEEKKRRAVKDTREAAEAYRQAAAIAAVAEPWKARDLYASAVKLDPSNVIGQFQHGQYQRETGQMEEAEAAYRQVLALATTADDDWEVYWSYLGLGDIQIARGNLDGAMGDFVAAGPAVERNASGNSPHPLWVHALFGWRLKVGDVLLRQRKLADALAYFEASRDLAEPQAKADPSDTHWQRDLSLAQERIGNLRKIEGNLPAALEAYRAAHVTAGNLAALDQSNAGLQRDLSVSYAKVGDVLQALGQLADALAAYKASVAIADRIAKTDPANVEWQLNLSNALEGAGEIHSALGNRPATLAAYQAALTVFERLTSAEPTIPRWQQGLARTSGRVAEVLAQGGGRDEALKLFRRARETMQRLRQQWPGNADYLKDLSWYEGKIAGLETR